MAISLPRYHDPVHGGAEGLRHHLCISHGEHRDEGTSQADLEAQHDYEHEYTSRHSRTYTCGDFEHEEGDEPGEWDDEGAVEGLGPIHRGIGVDLPDELHKFVHDRRRRPADRAQALLDHVREHPGGIGVHWTTEQSVGEDFAERNARGYAAPRKPGTAVVFHAAEPVREDIDQHIYADPTVYGHHDSGEREVPLVSGENADLTGISWAPMHDDEFAKGHGEYTRHDFGNEPRTAAAQADELIGHFEARNQEGGEQPVIPASRLPSASVGNEKHPLSKRHDTEKDVFYRLWREQGGEPLPDSQAGPLKRGWDDPDQPWLHREDSRMKDRAEREAFGLPSSDEDRGADTAEKIKDALLPDRYVMNDPEDALEHGSRVLPPEWHRPGHFEAATRPEEPTAQDTGYGASPRDDWPAHWTQPPEQRTGRPGEFMYRFQHEEFHDQTMREGIEPRRCAGHLPDDPDKTVYMTSDDHVFHARPEDGHPGTPEWSRTHGNDDSYRHYKIDVSGLPLVEDRTYTNPETGQKRSWMATEHIAPERIQLHLPGSEHGVTYDLPGGGKREWLPPKQAVARPGRGEKTCPCCGGSGSHGDGSECDPCDGFGLVHKEEPPVYCPGQPQPRRRHWRQAAAGGQDPFPARPGIFYRLHLRDQPLDEAHARSRPLRNPFPAPGKHDDPGRRGDWVQQQIGRPGYSAFASPWHLATYLNKQGWERQQDQTNFGDRDVVAFHGVQVGRGVDREPLVMPRADHSCCGRVIHSRTPWEEFSGALEEAAQPHLDQYEDYRTMLTNDKTPAGKSPWNAWGPDPVQKSVRRHEEAEQRRTQREAAMPKPDYDPADELPEGRGVWYRAHLRGMPLDEAHARSRPLRRLDLNSDIGNRGYSAFASPHHLMGYLDEYKWTDPDAEADMDQRDVIAFHGKQVGRGEDNEPLVVPEANPHCCGRVIHSRTPWEEFEDKLDGRDPDSRQVAPYEKKSVYPGSPADKSVKRHYRRETERYLRDQRREAAMIPPLSMSVEDLLNMHSDEALFHERHWTGNQALAHGESDATKVRSLYDAKADEMRQNPAAWGALDKPIRDGSIDPVLLRTSPGGHVVVDEGGHRIVRAHQLGVTRLPVSYDPGSQVHRHDWDDPEPLEEGTQHMAALPGEDYGYEHRPLGSADPIHEGAGIVGSREHPRYFTSGEDADRDEAVRQFRDAQGNPDHLVQVYRAAPRKSGGMINTGDWVTTAHGYARDLADDRNYHDPESMLSDPKSPPERFHVYEATVPARHLRGGGNDLMEFGYWGDPVEGGHSERCGQDEEHTAALEVSASAAGEPSNDYKDSRTAELLGHFEGAMEDSYRITHTAPSPEAGHKPLHHYQGGSPEDLVRVYRSAPAGTESINPGDWISLNPSYAHRHGYGEARDGGDWPVYTAEVPQRHVHWDENDPDEHGYNGPEIPHPDVHDEETGQLQDWDDWHDEHPHGSEAWMGGAVHLPAGDHEFVHDSTKDEKERADRLLDAAHAQGALHRGRWRDDLYDAREDAEQHAPRVQVPEGHRLTGFTLHRGDAGNNADIGLLRQDPEDGSMRGRGFIDFEDSPYPRYTHRAIDEAGKQKEASVRRQGINGETAPEGHDIWAEPHGTSPVAAELLHNMSTREPEDDHGTGWYRGISYHGPYHLIRHPQTRETYLVDRQGRNAEPHGRSFGNWQRDGLYRETVAQEHWHGLESAGPDAHRIGTPDEPSFAIMKERTPAFPHTRVDPEDAERVTRPDARALKPEGYSPEDEWHGPYEVVRHPETGKFHVVDNSGRHAPGSASWQGHDTQLRAERSRDYIDRRQQSKERGRELAGKIWGEETEEEQEGRESERNLAEGENLMARYEGGKGQIKFDSDEEGGRPYYEREHYLEGGRPSGWYVRHYGGTNADVYHRATGDTGHDMIWLKRHEMPDGSEHLSPAYGDEDLAADLKEWHDNPEGTRNYIENDKFGRQNNPGIHRWRQRHLGSLEKDAAAELIAHFENDPESGLDPKQGAAEIPEYEISKESAYKILDQQPEFHRDCAGARTVWLSEGAEPRCTGCGHRIQDPDTGHIPEQTRDMGVRQMIREMPDRQRAKSYGISTEAAMHALENPHTHGTEWYHGSPWKFGGFSGDEPDSPLHYEEDPGNTSHWNTLLGHHFAASHDAADEFSRGEHSSEPDGSYDDHEPAQNVLHARLDIRNPKVYKSEHDMDQEAYEHEWRAGNHHDNYHDPDEVADAREYDAEDELPPTYSYAGHNDRLRSRDEADSRYWNEHRQFHPYATGWLNAHPDKAGIAGRFRDRLQAAGHDGIVYGNEFEGEQIGKGDSHHMAAVPFTARQIDVTQRHTGPECHPPEAAARQWPGSGQPMLPGMETEASLDVLAHFEPPKTAAPYHMQQKLFDMKHSPGDVAPESGRHNPEDPYAHLDWRREHDPDYRPRECEHCGGDLNLPEDHTEHHENWLRDQDWYTDWDAVDLPSHLHRGMAMSLPQELHDKVHNPEIPHEERARALLHHVLGGTDPGAAHGGLGRYWSATPDVSKGYAEDTRIRHMEGESWQRTPVMLHIHTPDREHIETDPDELQHLKVITYHREGNEEVPLKYDAPLRVSGISWADPDHRVRDVPSFYDYEGRQRPGPHHLEQDPAWHHHEIGGEGIRATASGATPPETLELLAHFEEHRNPPCYYCGEPLDDEDVRDGASAHEECSDMRWCYAHQEHHDDPAETEQHNETYTDWGGHLPFEGGMHRGITVKLPPEVHAVVHDESRPGAERAAALSAHLRREPLGVHWTDREPIARAWGSGEGALFGPSEQERSGPSWTHVVMHAASPGEDHIETDPRILAERNMLGFDHHRSEREIPIKDDVPVTLTGFSWKHAGTPEDAWRRHDLPAPVQHTAALEQTGSSDGDRYVQCGQGHTHWGANGAAGLLIRHKDDDGQYRYLLQHRSPEVQHGDTWSTPGGAIGRNESPEEGARREAEEEFGELPAGLSHSHTYADDHGGWKYHTVVMDSPRRFIPRGGDEDSEWESSGHRWVTPAEMKSLPLHPGFAASWEKVRKSGALAIEASDDYDDDDDGYGGDEREEYWEPAGEERDENGYVWPLRREAESGIVEREPDAEPRCLTCSDRWGTEMRHFPELGHKEMAPYMEPPREGELREHLHHHHGLDSQVSDLHMSPRDQERWHDSEHRHKWSLPHQHDTMRGLPGERQYPDAFGLSEHTDFTGGQPVASERLREVLSDPERSRPFQPLRPSESVLQPREAALEPDANDIARALDKSQEELRERHQDDLKFVPDYGPLAKGVPEDERGPWMFMERKNETQGPHPGGDPEGIFTYKHGISRRKLHIDRAGNAWKPNGGHWAGPLDPQAVLHSDWNGHYRNLEKQGVTPQTPYDDAYRAERNRKLRESGWNVVEGSVPVDAALEVTAMSDDMPEVVAHFENAPEDMESHLREAHGYTDRDIAGLREGASNDRAVQYRMELTHRGDHVTRGSDPSAHPHPPVRRDSPPVLLPDAVQVSVMEHRVKQGLPPRPTEEERQAIQAENEENRQRRQREAEQHEEVRRQGRQRWLHDNGFANEDEHEQFMGQMEREHADIAGHYRRSHREEYDEGGEWHGDEPIMREHLASDHMIPNPDARAASHEHGLAGLHWQHHVRNREHAHPEGVSGQWQPVQRTRTPDEQALMDALGGDDRSSQQGSIDSFSYHAVQPYQPPPGDYGQMREHLISHHGFGPDQHMPRNLPGAQNVHRGLHLPGPIPAPAHQHDNPDDHHDPVFGSRQGQELVAHFDGIQHEDMDETQLRQHMRDRHGFIDSPDDPHWVIDETHRNEHADAPLEHSHPDLASTPEWDEEVGVNLGDKDFLHQHGIEAARELTAHFESEAAMTPEREAEIQRIQRIREERRNRPARRAGEPREDPLAGMWTPVPAGEMEEQRRAREPKPERLDDREYSIDDVSRHYDWEGFDPFEISHLVHRPEHATFTKEDVPVRSLRHVDEHGALKPPPSYQDIAGQGEGERERLEELERGYDQGAPVPPIVVVRHGEHHIIADGSHRAAVHARNGSTYIPAFVTERTIFPEQHTAALGTTATVDDSLDWDEIAARHPHVYGEFDENGYDGPRIADAAAELYHDRPGHPYSQTTGELNPAYGGEMKFYPRTVDPRRIDYVRAEPGDPRVRRAREGYESQRPERVPPLILVHRHGIFYPADGNHRANAAAQAHKPVRAYVAYSPHDEPFDAEGASQRAPDGRTGDSPRRGPFQGAELEDREPYPDQNGVRRRISYPGFPHAAEVGIPKDLHREAAKRRVECSECGGQVEDGRCRTCGQEMAVPRWMQNRPVQKAYPVVRGIEQADVDPGRSAEDDRFLGEHGIEAALHPGPDQRSTREERGDRWHDFRNRYSTDYHRGIHVSLPEHLDQYVHDESVPREDRARALQQHFADSGEGLGMHWTPHVQIAQRAIWNAADAGHGLTDGRLYHPEGPDVTTEVIFHVRKPGERNRLPAREHEEHGIGWNYSRDEDEFPLRPGSPLKLSGISWKRHEPQYPNEPFEHADFPKVIKHTSSRVPAHAASRTAASPPAGLQIASHVADKALPAPSAKPVTLRELAAPAGSVGSWDPQGPHEVEQTLRAIPRLIEVTGRGLDQLAARFDDLPVDHTVPAILREMAAGCLNVHEDLSRLLSTEGAWNGDDPKG